jgi:hypothetical protein
VSAHSNCASDPHACGYPDGTNTGVPASASLRSVPGQVSKGPGWHYDPRGWVEVTGNGAVIKDLYIPYNLDISASNVTVEDVKVETSGNDFGISLRHTRNVTIVDSDVYAPNAGSQRLGVGIKDIYADGVNTTIRSDNIWNTSTAIQMDSGLIVDTYIHSMGFQGGDHVNGITSNSGSSNYLTIDHNTVLNGFQQTDAIGLFEDFGTQVHRVIENNLLAGGGYTLYAGANPGGAATSDIVVTNNRFARLFFSHGGYFGPLTAFAAHGAGNRWSGNVWDATGVPVAS